MPEKAIENKNKNTKRGLKVAAIAGGLVLVGGVAFAYWTQGGSGTGEVSTGTTSAAGVEVTQDDLTAQVAPGVDVPLSGHIKNTNEATIHVATITGAVTDVTDGSGPDCDASDYSVTGGAATMNKDLTKNGSTSWDGLTLHFNTSSTDNQDDCKGATVEITYTTH
jgi:hypothetical protein